MPESLLCPGKVTKPFSLLVHCVTVCRLFLVSGSCVTDSAGDDSGHLVLRRSLGSEFQGFHLDRAQCFLL